LPSRSTAKEPLSLEQFVWVDELDAFKVTIAVSLEERVHPIRFL
jgi:hypothetical protein